MFHNRSFNWRAFLHKGPSVIGYLYQWVEGREEMMSTLEGIVPPATVCGSAGDSYGHPENRNEDLKQWLVRLPFKPVCVRSMNNP